MASIYVGRHSRRETHAHLAHSKHGLFVANDASTRPLTYFRTLMHTLCKVRCVGHVTRYNSKEAGIVIDLPCSFFRRNEAHEQAITDHMQICRQTFSQDIIMLIVCGHKLLGYILEMNKMVKPGGTHRQGSCPSLTCSKLL